MDATILALIKSDPKRKLMPEKIAAVNAYVIAGKTADLVQLGTEVGSNAINYHKSKTKLSDHGEYLGAVKAGFDRASPKLTASTKLADVTPRKAVVHSMEHVLSQRHETSENGLIALGEIDPFSDVSRTD